jgi:hypothetical protein
MANGRLGTRPSQHRDLRSKGGFSGRFRAHSAIFVQRRTWVAYRVRCYAVDPHLGGVSSNEASFKASNKGWVVRDHPSELRPCVPV